MFGHRRMGGALNASSMRRLAKGGILLFGLLLLSLLAAAQDKVPPSTGAASEQTRAKSSAAATVVKKGGIVPPKVAPPCRPGNCPFAGQTVTVIVSNSIIFASIPEVKDEFEAATGAKLNIVQVPFKENFENFLSDVINHAGKYDASIVGAWSAHSGGLQLSLGF